MHNPHCLSLAQPSLKGSCGLTMATSPFSPFFSHSQLQKPYLFPKRTMHPRTTGHLHMLSFTLESLLLHLSELQHALGRSQPKCHRLREALGVQAGQGPLLSALRNSCSFPSTHWLLKKNIHLIILINGSHRPGKTVRTFKILECLLCHCFPMQAPCP